MDGCDAAQTLGKVCGGPHHALPAHAVAHGADTRGIGVRGRVTKRNMARVSQAVGVASSVAISANISAMAESVRSIKRKSPERLEYRLGRTTH